MAAVMQPPRPSMDRSSSFDQARRVSPAAFPSSSTPSRPSLSHRDSHASSHHRHSFNQTTAPAPTHSRSSSSASNQRPGSIKSSSPYQQPYPSHHAASYFPPAAQQPFHGIPQPQQAWTTPALPASAFYTAPFHNHGYVPGGNQVFHHGFQQSQADFAAWAGAYHNMMMASGQSHGGQGMFVPPTEYLHEDRPRSVSSPQPCSPYDRPISPPHLPPVLQQQQPQQQQQQPPTQQTKPPVQAFHPYKRQPDHRPSRENMANATVMPRSVSQPILPTSHGRPAQSQAQTRSSGDHHRSPSLDTTIAPAKRVERASPSFEREREPERTSSTSSAATAKGPNPASNVAPVPSPTTVRTVTPLHTGPIANATNTPSPASRPSPLSNTITPAEPEKKSLKGRFKKALNGGDSKRSTPPASTVSTPAKTVPTTPSGTSTRSATPIATPRFESTEVPLNPPSAPFAVANPSAMSSEVSLAETTRTTTTLAGDGGTKEKKKGLFRMKNMSTDNISLSSTVSSASMMIRRMGSIGKLARRNSLAGISKIFKDKPKDEDAALPEVDADSKKDKKKEKRKRQKDKKKAEAAPAAVSHATAESDRLSNEEEDRALAGLSPAAKLARQHTLRSKAEQAKKDRETRAQQQQNQTGEPTWDNNTQTRNGPPVLPSIDSMTSGLSSFADSPSPTSSGPEVLRVQPRSRQTVVHAVNVADHEYDSEEDSSDGETIEDVTIGIAKTRLSQDTQGTIEADEDFKARWGNAWIDRNAVPKKGILKQAHSFTEGLSSRQRSSSTADAAVPAVGPLSHIPPSDPAQIDGLAHPSPQQSKGVDFAEHLDDSIGDFRGGPYQNPAHNSSAPSLSLLTLDGRPRPPQAGRSMTVPARKRLNWAPECAVYTTYDAGTYDRRSEPATCNRLTPELAMAIKQELNAFKMEMPVHPQSRGYTHYFA